MPKCEIIYGEFKSPLGPMIAGATDSGVCFLEWHDRGGVERIKARVEKRYKALLRPGRSQHIGLLQAELNGYFEGTLREFTIPIDVTGTPFEKKVWAELRKIPYGKTRSYGQLAKLVGKPQAVRAVARANGANYLGIVIPCHRVIQTDGGLGGYGGKIWRKRYLLELESGLSPQLPLDKL